MLDAVRGFISPVLQGFQAAFEIKSACTASFGCIHECARHHLSSPLSDFFGSYSRPFSWRQSMNRFRHVRILLLGFLVSGIPVAGIAAENTDNACIKCHQGISPGQVADWRASKHRREKKKKKKRKKKTKKKLKNEHRKRKERKQK
jgi:hypothetical protein